MVRGLRLRKNREREAVFFVEGIRAVWEAIEQQAPIERLLVAPGLLDSDSATRLVETQERLGLPSTHLGAAAFRSLSEREHPTGLAAIVRTGFTTLSKLVVPEDSIVVALDRPSGPGNLGAIVRTADSVNASGVVLMGDSADPYDPQAVRASMGSIFSIPLARAADLEETLAWAANRGLQVITTSAHAQTEHTSVRYRLPLLLVLGSESHGLSPDALQRGEFSVRIPMRGRASSLNLAVAAGVLLFEIRRQESEEGRNQ
jgi:RNA methyltransferase, TrmH family